MHSHTWYANMAGHLGKLLYDVPHVVTAHSLEPQRPWKAEQLGGGYRLSSWAERTAYEAADAVIAVSDGMAADILAAYPDVDPDRIHVIHNGIDADFYRPDPATDVLERLGVDLGPALRRRSSAGSPGRRACRTCCGPALRFDPRSQLVLLAGAADTPELKAETDARSPTCESSATACSWSARCCRARASGRCSRHALAFVCPSVYEPLGIVNLEAMACETAVVASAVGGIPEVVVDGETGLLVDYTPEDAVGFEAAIADAVNRLAADPSLAAQMGRAGRERAVTTFDWSAIADETVSLYESLV